MLLAMSVLLLLSLGLDLLAPLLLKQLVDTTLASHDLARINFIIALFVVVYFSRFAADLGSGKLRNRFNEGFLLDLRRRLFRHIQTLSIPFFATQRTGYLASRILSDASLLSGQLLAIFLGLLSSGLLLGGSVVIVFWLNCGSLSDRPITRVADPPIRAAHEAGD
jgi:ABC-type multidrug transport system fused ATPase/permease subunit